MSQAAHGDRGKFHGPDISKSIGQVLWPVTSGELRRHPKTQVPTCGTWGTLRLSTFREIVEVIFSHGFPVSKFEPFNPGHPPDQDALPGFAAKLKFAVGIGDGWRKGGIHFGGPVDQLLKNAFDGCDDNSLGKALHGLQDDLSHSGPYAQPWVHYVTSVLGAPVGLINPADHPGLQLANEIAGDTATIL